MKFLISRLGSSLLQRGCARLCEVERAHGSGLQAHLLSTRLGISSAAQMQPCNSLAAGHRASAVAAVNPSNAPLLTALLPPGSSSTTSSRTLRIRQFSCSASALSGAREQPWHDSWGPARLQSLRLQPAPRPGRMFPLAAPMHALSPAWPQQPDGQQRGFSGQQPWWQFWGRSSSSTSSSDGSSGDEGSSAVLRPPEPLPEGSPSAAHERELKAVNTAVVVNAIIFVAKMVTWAITGSGALLAEGLHSAADVANQLLLKQGVIRSRRKPTRQHQYGFHKEKHVYALISAACVFCVGCGASVLHGVSSLLNPHELENMVLSLAVLLGSSVLEAYSLRVAFQSIQRSAEEQGTGLWQYIKRGRDPTTVAILWEDGGAVAGLGLAGGFTLLTWMTGQPHWDALGSIAVGMLMGVIALQLMRTNKRFLIGQAMEPAVERAIVEHLQNDSMVVRVIDPKSEEMGDGVFRFKAEIQWNGDHVVQKYLNSLGRDSVYRNLRGVACRADVDSHTMADALDLAMMDFGKGVIRTVGTEIDRLESELKVMVPGLVYVDLETDKGSTASIMGSGDWVPEPPVDLGALQRTQEQQQGEGMEAGATTKRDAMVASVGSGEWDEAAGGGSSSAPAAT